MTRIIAISAVVAALALPFGAQALGVSVTPATVAVSAHPDEPTVARIRVTNPSRDVALFEVYPDELETMVTVTPASFTLESNEEREVLIRITAQESGQWLTTLSVVGRLMADSSFQAGSGVKVPLTITVSQPSSLFAASIIDLLSGKSWLGALLVLALVGLFVYRRYTKQHPAA